MKKTNNNNIARNRRRASFIIMGLASVLFLIFSVRFFRIMVLGNIHNVDLRAEINDKIVKEGYTNENLDNKESFILILSNFTKKV